LLPVNLVDWRKSTNIGCYFSYSPGAVKLGLFPQLTVKPHSLAGEDCPFKNA
jgi:hypothetical protein